jgi:glycosyltransferase involved in cell wall biosynthesis
MKLVVMIPCLNEEHTLPDVIRTIPATIPRISRIETLIIDDGSTDNTIEVAQNLGVNTLSS